MNDAVNQQPSPRGHGVVVLPYVLEAVRQRAELGKERYGTYLSTDNGRDALVDAFQEAIDLVMYIGQALMERSAVQEEQ